MRIRSLSEVLAEVTGGSFLLSRADAVDVAWSLDHVLRHLPADLDPAVVQPLRDLRTAVSGALHPKEAGE